MSAALRPGTITRNTATVTNITVGMLNWVVVVELSTDKCYKADC